jgi:hypothetical protein
MSLLRSLPVEKNYYYHNYSASGTLKLRRGEIMVEKQVISNSKAVGATLSNVLKEN